MATEKDISDQFNAAIDFALNDIQDDFTAIMFLRMWREGMFPEIRKEFPNFKGPFPK